MFDQCRVRDWLDCHGLLNRSVEEFAAILECSAVEPKRVFIKVPGFSDTLPCPGILHLVATGGAKGIPLFIYSVKKGLV